MTRVLILALTLVLVPFHLPAQTGPAISKEGSAESCIELLRGFEQRMYKNLH